MKTKRFITLFASLFLTLSIVASTTSNKPFVGTWQYNDQTLPYGYQEGIVQIDDKEGELLASIIIQGYEIKARNVSVKGNQATAMFNVEGFAITSVLERSGEHLIAKTEIDGSSVNVKCAPFRLADALEGNWTAQVTDAPNGNAGADITFQKGMPIVKIDNYAVPVSSVKIEGLKVSFDVNVDGQSVYVSLNWTGNNLSGNASVSGEYFKVIANRSGD